MLGVVSVGLVDKTTFPVPVEVVTPVPPPTTAKTPVELAFSARNDKLRGMLIQIPSKKR
jgi:hypothetical protein